jgi:hypothetical protein
VRPNFNCNKPVAPMMGYRSRYRGRQLSGALLRVQGSLFGLKSVDGHCNQNQGEAIIDDFLLASEVPYRCV